MDPVTSIGLAFNVLSFVRFAGDCLTEGVELYRSADGSSQRNHELENITTSLNNMNLEIMAETSQDGYPRSSPQLVTLAKECNKIANDFLAKLERMRVSSETKRNKLESAAKAAKIMWKQKDIEGYTTRLGRLSAAMEVELLRQISSQQYALSVRIENFCRQFTMSEVQNMVDNSDLCKQIASLDEDMKSRKLPSNYFTSLEFLSRLSNLNDAQKQIIRNIRIIDSLRFPEKSLRESKVHNAHNRTFEWIFDDYTATHPQSQKLVDWLRSSQSELFWVTGRPGSGKSTLMKFLLQHEQTRTLLQTWAKERKLIITGHFFWNPGTEQQKSLEGLLQTLLHDIFEQCPQLIEHCMASSHIKFFETISFKSKDPPSWSRTRLLEAFKLLAQQPSESTVFCFFIDGLDEYYSPGLRPFGDLLEVVSQLTKTNHIKICASSRPWTEFRVAFSNSANGTLALHDLTANDIKLFIKDNLATDRRFRELECQDIRYSELIEEISQRSRGVFLWVFLVVKSLLQGVANEDTISVLRRRVRELPPDLEDLFRVIVGRTDRVYRQEAWKIYQVCLSNQQVEEQMPIPLMLLLFLVEPETSFNEIQHASSWKTYHILDKCNILEKRVEARCRDLLEISYGHHQKGTIFIHTVDFLHRTVADFLRENNLRKIFGIGETEDFQPHLYYCRAALALSNVVGSEEDDHISLKAMLSEHEKLLSPNGDVDLF